MPDGTQKTQDEELTSPARLVRTIADALTASDLARARELADGLLPPDLAQVVELLEPSQRVTLIEALGPDIDYAFFSELDEAVRDQLSEALPNELLAKAVATLETDDAAYLIESLEPGDQQEILAHLPTSERALLERNLVYPPDSAGRLMQGEFVAVAPFWTIGQVIDHMRDADDLPDSFAEIFVVDPSYSVVGSVDLSRLLRTKRHVAIDQIMEPERHIVRATADQRDVARQFERYDLVSAPVVDEDDRLVGVITVDDVVDVIQEEAEEDIKALAGVGQESVSGSVLGTVRSRMPWLIVNLATAILASTVIQRFGATIEQMVALAALMPIVASIGGNAGTQTMTVTVRALATDRLGPVNAARVVGREAIVGLLNGIVLSFILAGIVLVWFGSGLLSVVIAAAIIVNVLAAALAGILFPLSLHALDLDPAPASGVLVTTVTDVVGFFAFLGLATLWLV